MDADRWARIEALYGAALSLPPEDRARFLDERCGDDPELRAEVDGLLAETERDPDFLEIPMARISLPDDPEHGSGDAHRVGPYRLVRPLGAGGMGEVHLAVHEGDDFSRHVAIKLVRPGMDTRDVLDRFRLERRILASLNHPAIAHLVDGGATPDGHPYFVMEYVEGSPIDQYCDQRSLSVNERLELFIEVCAGVEHAHRNLVVHRDLKPSNILVTPEGRPKLLDFGIGKVLAQEPGSPPQTRTRASTRVLTPEYAAPEQLEGGLITTATDVYSLGVLLYELLTGHHPRAERAGAGDGGGPIPTAPSDVVARPATRVGPDGAHTLEPDELASRRRSDTARLRRALAGDIDTIIRKAMRTEPERRYGSVAALADDLERHLRGHPVRARPDTLAYRTRKFVRRNALAVAAAAVVASSLGATSVITTVQSRRIQNEASRVIRERDKALEIRSLLLETFGATGADGAVGDSVTVRAVLDGQRRVVDQELASDPELLAEMKAVLADAYQRLGIFEPAEALAREALAAQERLFGAGSAEVAATRAILGWVLYNRAEYSEARSMLESAIETWRSLPGDREVAVSKPLNDVGIVYFAMGELDLAEAAFTEALEIRRRRLSPTHRSVAITASNLGTALMETGRAEEAVDLFREAVEALEARLGPDHLRTSIGRANLAAVQARLGNHDVAARELASLVEARKRTLGAQHPETALAMTSLGVSLMYLGRHDQADSLFRAALIVQEAVLGKAHPEVARTHRYRANLAQTLDDHETALASYEGALESLRAALGDAHPEVTRTAALRAYTRFKLGDLALAEAELRAALAMDSATVGADALQTASHHRFLADVLMRGGRPDEALEGYRAALAIYERSDASVDRPGVALARVGAAEALWWTGRTAAADSTARALESELPAEPDYDAMRARLAALR